MRKSALATVIVTIALAISGCSSITPTSSPTFSSGARPEVTGFGATLSAWNAHHVADKSRKFIRGCCYNPDPKVKSWGANFRYSDLVLTHGIVTDYSLNLPENTKLNEAQTASLAELPKDAKVAFFFSQKESATLEVRSATLEPILRNLKIAGTNGSVDFIFCSVAKNGKYGYNPSNVNSVWAKVGFGLAAAKDAVC